MMENGSSTDSTTMGFATLLVCGLLLTACGPTEKSGGGEEDDTGDSVPTSKTKAADRVNKGKADWSVDICDRNSWYGDKACDWFCPEDDPDCAVDPLGSDPSGDPTSHPIVLHHGFMGADSGLWAYNGVKSALEGDGHRVLQTEVPPFHSVETRAKSLRGQIDEFLKNNGAQRVNIVAHSMGGLDARYLVSSLDYADKVASVTTISSPHGGTLIADAYLGIVPGFADKAVDAVSELAGRTFSNVADNPDIRAAMEDLAVDNSEAFDTENPNVDGVYYQSWAGVSSVEGVRVDGVESACDGKLLMHDGTIDHMDSLLWAAAAVTANGTDLELNDGMATVESAKWGNFQGCIPADHLDQVGQIGDEGPDENTGFDHIRFYRNLAYRLAARGF